MTIERQISIERDPATGDLQVLLWSGIEDPHLISIQKFGSIDLLRRYLVGLGRGVGVLWSPELLAERGLAITVSVALGVPLPNSE